MIKLDAFQLIAERFCLSTQMEIEYQYAGQIGTASNDGERKPPRIRSINLQLAAANISIRSLEQ